MGKKVAFTKGSNKVNFKKNPLAVKKPSQQKKPKVVKSHVKKLKANVTAQQERADKRMKDLHIQMATQHKKPARAIPFLKKEKTPDNASTVHTNLEKMHFK